MMSARKMCDNSKMHIVYANLYVTKEVCVILILFWYIYIFYLNPQRLIFITII